MYNDQFTLREAAEAKLRGEKKILSPSAPGIISVPVSNNIEDRLNNNCNDISKTKRSSSRFIQLPTTATKISLSTSEVSDENIIANGFIGDTQQFEVSTLSKQKNCLLSTKSSKEGKVNVMKGINSSLVSNCECCSHSVSSITVISQEDFVSAAKKMLNKKQKRRKKNKSDNKHAIISHKKSSLQHSNQLEKEENPAILLKQISSWDSLSVGSIMTQETRSILSSEFSSCDDVDSSEEDDVLTALSVSTTLSSSNHQSLSSQSGRRIQAKQHHQSKKNNNKSSSRFRLLGPTLDLTTTI